MRRHNDTGIVITSMAGFGATAPSRRIPVKDRTPLLLRPIHGGARGNAPGSGTAELTKLEIRPDLDHDEIAGWRRRGHRDADGQARCLDFAPVVGRYRTPATRRLSFHSGMESGCVSALRRDAVRTLPR